jgi:hypothetical protein
MAVRSRHSRPDAGVSALAFLAGLLAMVAALIVAALTIFQSDGDSVRDTPIRSNDELSNPTEVPGTEIDEEAVPDEEHPDYCTLLTEQEAEAAAGVDLPTGLPYRAAQPNGGESGSCRYIIAADGRAATLVQVVVFTEVPREAFETEMAANPEWTDIAGPGDINKHVPGIVSVWDDRDVSLTVQGMLPSGPIATDILVGIAQRALDRL